MLVRVDNLKKFFIVLRVADSKKRFCRFATKAMLSGPPQRLLFLLLRPSQSCLGGDPRRVTGRRPYPRDRSLQTSAVGLSPKPSQCANSFAPAAKTDPRPRPNVLRGQKGDGLAKARPRPASRRRPARTRRYSSSQTHKPGPFVPHSPADRQVLG